MYSNWNSPNSQYQSDHRQINHDQQQVMQRLANLEHRLELLLSSLEKTNETLRSIEELQNRVCTTGGGGAVIVRM
ncbi:hypothetical protein ABES25_16465 [Bacillus gobiensis]|uniref:hypothetical protein n=1 Tax=Bacillus gobiensis TaxID=1441095 RepID=UPI003D19BF69